MKFPVINAFLLAFSNIFPAFACLIMFYFPGLRQAKRSKAAGFTAGTSGFTAGTSFRPVVTIADGTSKIALLLPSRRCMYGRYI